MVFMVFIWLCMVNHLYIYVMPGKKLITDKEGKKEL